MTLAHVHPIADSKNGHPTIVSRYGQNFEELNIHGFDFTDGFKGSDVRLFEKLITLPLRKFELSFYREGIE